MQRSMMKRLQRILAGNQVDAAYATPLTFPHMDAPLCEFGLREASQFNCNFQVFRTDKDGHLAEDAATDCILVLYDV